MADLLSTIAPYVPAGVIRATLALPEISGEPITERFPAAVLFADVSGFTPLTEALGQKGAEGPEELTRLLNSYFSHMIALMEAEGGEVVKFSGDALTVLFPATDQPLAHAARRAFQAAQAMQAAMADFTTLPTSIGEISLGMKIGIGAGEVLSMQVGGVNDRWEYVVAGDPLRQVAEAEDQAERGDIIASPETAAVLHPEPLPPQPLVQPDWSAISDLDAVQSRLRSYLPLTVQHWLGEGLHDWLAVLRSMSVLFVGIEGLDYAEEDAVQQLHHFLRTAQKSIYRYQGILRQLVVDDKGTVMLVFFGAPPYAHEDDPVRAVRCALDMVAASEELPVQLAIGVTTGHVFSGPVGSATRREYAAVGDTVNLAARLMGTVYKMGQVGREGILCDFDTYRQAENHIEFKGLPPVRVKGKAGLIRIYRPIGPVAGRSSQIEQGAIVGRKAELAQLEKALDAIEAGQSRVFIIQGEAGIGKTRLVEELTNIAKKRGLTWLMGAGQSIEQQTAYRAWRDVFSYYFGLGEITDPFERQARVQGLIQEIAPDQIERLPLLNDILNLDFPDTTLTGSLDPALRHQSLVLLLLYLLRTWARERPLIVILDDVHWLDSLSWDLVAYLARAITVSPDPLLLVVVARPLAPHSTGGQHLEKLQSLTEAETLPLDSLSPEETVALATARLGLPEGELPPAVAELARTRSGGNPFFAEQLVFTLRDQGLIEVERKEGQIQCTLRGDLDQASQKLPGTIQGLVLARIDRLPPEQQLTLKVAAVIGRTFAYPTLQHTLTQHTAIDGQALQAHLAALAAFELTPLDTPEPERTYLFKHIVTQEVAYQTLLFARRRTLHCTVAEWYETTFGGEKDETTPSLDAYLPLLVHHYHQAQDFDKECQYARLAGKHAQAQFANTEAVRYFTRALELIPAEALVDQYDLLLNREQVYDLQGERESQYRDLAALEVLVKRLGDLRKQATVALRRAHLAEVGGDYPAAIHAAQEAIELSRQRKFSITLDWETTKEITRLQAAGYLQWGRVLWLTGEYDSARPQLEQALKLAQSARLRQEEANSLRNLGITFLDQGEYAQATSFFEQALQSYRESGDRQSEGASLSNLGTTLFEQGDFGGAQEYYERALHILREIGWRRGESIMLNNLGTVLVEQGDYAGARAYSEQALRIYYEIGEPLGESMTLNNLGFAALTQGDHTSAQTYFEQARKIFREIGDQRGESIVLSNLGLLMHHMGENEISRKYSEQALRIAGELGDRPTLGEILTHLGHARAGEGKLQGASEAYQRALELRRELGEHTLAIESLAGLARISLAQDKLPQALLQVEEILDFLRINSLDGTEEPFRIYLTCYHVLRASEDPRAVEILKTAYSQLQEWAGRIPDEETRRSFLQNVAVHRAIVHEYENLG
jgi:class 3 adenylate cyclase/tetratricopeptide (TPR) repeat protein